MSAPPLRALVAVVALALLASACSDDDAAAPATADPASTPAPADEPAGSAGGGDATADPEPPAGSVDHTGVAEVTVAVTDNVFTDQHIVITAGTTVTWTNDGRNDHNVTPDAEGAFEPVATAALGPGSSAAVTFDTPGVYPYHCSLHGAPGRAQYGTIVVEAA